MYHWKTESGYDATFDSKVGIRVTRVTSRRTRDPRLVAGFSVSRINRNLCDPIVSMIRLKSMKFKSKYKHDFKYIGKYRLQNVKYFL